MTDLGKVGKEVIAPRFGPKTYLRFVTGLLPADQCWNWQRLLDDKGYGDFDLNESSEAHRAAYELFVGPIPEGFHIDHLCRNPSCVNPAHLEPVTQAENNWRAAKANRTHCKHGHVLDEANTYIYFNSRGHRCRMCRKCQAARMRERRAS